MQIAPADSEAGILIDSILAALGAPSPRSYSGTSASPPIRRSSPTSVPRHRSSPERRLRFLLENEESRETAQVSPLPSEVEERTAVAASLDHSQLARIIEQQSAVIAQQAASLDDAARHAVDLRKLERKYEERLRSTSRDFQERIDELQEKLDHERRSASEFQSQAQKARSEADSTLKELESAKNAVVAANSEIALLQQTVIELRKERATIAAVAEQHNEVNAIRVQELEKEVARLRSSNQALQEQRAMTFQDIASFQRDAKAWESKVTLLEHKLAYSEAKLREVTSFVTDSLTPFVETASPFSSASPKGRTSTR